LSNSLILDNNSVKGGTNSTLAKVYFEEISGRSYKEVWEYQGVIQQSLVNQKRANALKAEVDKTIPVHHLIFCEHNHVFTLGKSGSEDHLIIDAETLEKESIEFFKINRGGDITYHGPGQITGYPILDLDYFSTDVHLYVRNLEEAVIRTIAEYGLKGERIKEYTGVWLIEKGKMKRKICAIGVHLSRWVTMHGFAFNVNTNLKYFDFIIPCGIVDPDKTVTSLQEELGQKVDMKEVKEKLKFHLAAVFGYEYSNQ
jgi:lipoyl(octanoyl) transferase